MSHTVSACPACPACGSHVKPHCDLSDKDASHNRECTWWKCSNRNCNSYGYDARRFIDMRRAS